MIRQVDPAPLGQLLFAREQLGPEQFLILLREDDAAFLVQAFDRIFVVGDAFQGRFVGGFEVDRFDVRLGQLIGKAVGALDDVVGLVVGESEAGVGFFEFLDLFVLGRQLPVGFILVFLKQREHARRHVAALLGFERAIRLDDVVYDLGGFVAVLIRQADGDEVVA